MQKTRRRGPSAWRRGGAGPYCGAWPATPG